MRMRISTLLVACTFLLIGAGLAAAQQLAADSQSGPLVLTPNDTSIVFSPDVKITDVDHHTSTMLGFYTGKMFDSRLLLGGAGYWLVDPHEQVGLYYFGFLTGYRLLGTQHVALDGRVLAGFGAGTIYRGTYAQYPPRPGHHGQTYSGYYAYWDDFFMAEPQVVLDLSLTQQAHINLGLGYRATTADGDFNDAFRGVTGSIGVRFDLK